MKPPSEPHGLLCHYFDGIGFPSGQGSISADSLNAVLDEYGPRLVPAKLWLQRLFDGQLTDEIVVTFDDGLYEAYALALPVLEERGLTACWNVYTGPYVGVPNNIELYRWLRNHGFGDMDGFYAKWGQTVDSFWTTQSFYVGPEREYLTENDKFFRQWRDDVGNKQYEEVMDILVSNASMDIVGRQWWMTPAQLRDLHRSGHIIGIHTHSHPYDMGRLSLEQTALEYATARAVLAGVLECDPRTITTMSHPRGLYRSGGIEWLKANGFTMGWGATMGGSAPWTTPRWSTGNWPL